MTIKREAKQEHSSPIFRDVQMKLGVFGFNCYGGTAITVADEVWGPTWKNNLQVARTADKLGLEALIPLGRWRGFGGPSDFGGVGFETYTWAAGLSQATSQIAVLATSHVPTVHPLFAAKQATTIDQMSDGRFGLNIVCGWFTPEMEMFGGTMREHDQRYEVAQEWIDVMRKVWSTDGHFDHEGKFFKLKQAFAEPKPLQRPFPPLVNAGGSTAGKHFAAKNCDIAFLILNPEDIGAAKAQIASYRDLARKEYNREIQVWAYSYVVQRETQKEAEDYANYYAQVKGDDIACDNILRELGVQSGIMSPADLQKFRFHFKAGWGGYPLVGTKERIVDRMKEINEAGLDGICFSWVDYEAGVDQLGDLMPVIKQAGLRDPDKRKL